MNNPTYDELKQLNADLVAALEAIASDCADLQRVDIVSHAEARTWKTIENRARTAIANAKHGADNSTKERT